MVFPSLATLGTGLNVASSAVSLGSALGIGGGKKRGPSLEDQLAANLQAEQNSFQYKMDAAKKYGISKLAMLGIPSYNAPSFQYDGGSQDSSMFGMGQGLQRAAAALGDASDRSSQETLTKLQLEGAQLDNDYKRSLIRSMTAAGTAPAFPGGASPVVPGQGDSRYPPQQKMPTGYGDAGPLLRVGVDENGNPIRVYNDDLGDNEILQALTAVRYSIPDYIHGNVGKPLSNWYKKRFQQYRNNPR